MTAASIMRMQHKGDDIRMFGSSSNYAKLLARGTFGGCAMCLYYVSIQLLPLGDAVTLFFTNAVFTAVASVLVGYEQPSWSMLLACTSCTGTHKLLTSAWIAALNMLMQDITHLRTIAGGVILISKPVFLFGGTPIVGDKSILGVLAALGSACSAVGAFLSIKSLGNSEKPIVMSMWFHTVSFVAAVLPLCAGYPDHAVMPTIWECVLLTQIVWTSFFGQLMLSRGFQLLSPSVAAAMNLSQVVHARFLSIVFLHDSLQWNTACGSLLVCGGVLAAQLGKNNDRGGVDSIAAQGMAHDVEDVSLLSLADMEHEDDAYSPILVNADVFGKNNDHLDAGGMELSPCSSGHDLCPVFVSATALDDS
jgi:drug/metabolite transporter (DMT)-like permease